METTSITKPVHISIYFTDGSVHKYYTSPGYALAQIVATYTPELMESIVSIKIKKQFLFYPGYLLRRLIYTIITLL